MFFEKYIPSHEVQLLNKDGIEKTAEEKKDISKAILDFIKGIRPNKDKEIYVHTIIMGDGETWGSNHNGDYFPGDDLYNDGDAYGYKTFLSGGIYVHHKNKNKGRSLGNITLSVINPVMRRIELIERVDRQLSREFDEGFGVYDRLNDGEILMKSMGCKVPFDICSICANKAKTRHEYCDHARNHMNKVYPDGKKVFVLNPKPVFFDSSYVGSPAFKPANIISILKEKDGAICLGNICVIDMGHKSKEGKKDKKEDTKEMEKKASDSSVKKKGHPTNIVMRTTHRGVPVFVEVRSGDYRYGYARGGRWKKKMYCHYGFIPNLEGADGEEVDVYLKPHAKKDGDVYIVKQVKEVDGHKEFDEDKVMLGFDSPYEARSTYLQHMAEKYFGGLAILTFDQFKEYLKNLDQMRKSAAIIKQAFCDCSADCCSEKVAENKEADLIKRIPALSAKIPTDVLSKIREKSSLHLG